MANVVFNSFKLFSADGTIDLDSDTFKVMLVTSGYTADKDAHDFRDDVTNEVSGTGYSAGGVALANPTLTQDNPNDLVKWDADDTVYSTVTITARAAVIYKSRGGASSADELVMYVDFGADKTATGADLTITWNASGILTLGE